MIWYWYGWCHHSDSLCHQRLL